MGTSTTHHNALQSHESLDTFIAIKRVLSHERPNPCVIHGQNLSQS